ncbi:hypothetical protein QJS10_CPA02g00359 [Acorus calamus]|uniref:Uncharacterized protein n=1 Tax=Acorus calamus TaxID=4465 RepID=A0AAV9F9W5_ACOCL|nr:hypothetical protein QJS10_CPA02g00359 [Acorus calamus]
MPRLQFTQDTDQIHWKKDSDGCASNEWLSITDRLLDRIGPSIETGSVHHRVKGDRLRIEE